MGPRWLQDRSKTGSTAIKKTVHFLIRFFTRLGVVLGSFWVSFWSPKSTQKFSRDWEWTVRDVDFSGCFGGGGGGGGGLGPLLGALGLSGWPPCAFQSASLPCDSILQNLVLLLNVFEAKTFSKSTTFCNGYETTHKSIKVKPNDSIHRFDLLMRLVDCTRMVLYIYISCRQHLSISQLGPTKYVDLLVH